MNRILFLTTTRFGQRCLDLLFSLKDISLVGVISTPEIFRISYQPSGVRNYLYSDLGIWCKDRKVPYLQIDESMNEDLVLKEVKELSPDIILVVGWYYIVNSKWRAIAPAFGLHASLLPDYSGGAPLVWALINGESKTGITFFKLSEKIDAGEIVAQAITEISEEDTISTLYSRIEDLGLDLLRNHLFPVLSGSAPLIPQDESRRRIFPQRKPEDGRIDWKLDSKNLYNFIRAQTKPYPGAFTFFNKKKVHIWAARLHSSVGSRAPGAIEVIDGSLIVGSGNNTSLEILDATLENDSQLFEHITPDEPNQRFE